VEPARAGLGAAEHTIADLLPGVQVEARDVELQPHAGGRRGQRLEHADAPAQHPRGLAGELAQVLRRHHIAQLQAQRVAGRLSGRERLGHQRVGVAQRQRLLGRLAQGRRQLGSDAHQVAGHGDLRVAVDEAHAQAVRRLSAQRGGEAGQRADLRRAPQSVGGGHALAGEANAAVGLGAAFEARVTAQHARDAAAQAEALLGERDPRARRAEQRRVGRHAHVVAGQRHRALHRRRVDVGQRNGQAEPQVGRAAGARLRQRAVDPPTDRRSIDVAQHVGQRTAPLAVEHQHRLVVQRADAAADLAQLDAIDARLGVADLHRGTVEDQLAAHLAEGRPRRLLRCLRAAGRRVGHVGELQVVDQAGDAELALLRIAHAVEGKVPQVAADAHGEVLDRAAAHRARDVGARVLRNAQRQVARDPRRDAAGQLAAQLELAGIAAAPRHAAAGAGGPAAGDLAVCVGVGELGVLHLQHDLRRHAGLARGVDAPLQRCAELVELEQRLLEHAGKIQPAARHGDPRFAAAVVGAERDAGVAQARAAHSVRLRRRLRRERQPAQHAADRVTLWPVQRPPPARVEVGGDALRAQLGQQLAQPLAERHARGHPGDHREIETLRAEVAA
jgi:hypothetical protein